MAGAPGCRAYLADRQTAGRGRHNRQWRSAEGNLYFSAVLRPGAIAPVPAFWSLMAGIAVQQAIASFMQDGQPVLKWPNDVLLLGAKVAGVLIDSALTAQGMLDWVVIGVGINLAHAPALPDRSTACLAQLGMPVTPQAMAEAVMMAIDDWRGRDLATIRAAWLARAHPAGTPLRVQYGERVIQGEFEGLADDGALLLRGYGPLVAGEVTYACV